MITKDENRRDAQNKDGRIECKVTENVPRIAKKWQIWLSGCGEPPPNWFIQGRKEEDKTWMCPIRIYRRFSNNNVINQNEKLSRRN